MKSYIKEYFQIDIFGKIQPVIIRLTGTKDDFCAYVSTSDKYPEEQNCQQTFRNTRKIEFYVNGNKDQQAGKKLYVQSLYICMESGQDV